MFSSPELAKKFVEFSVEEDLGSDHNIITATLKLPGTLQPKPTKTIKLYHKANWKHINNTITTQMANTTLNNKSTKKDIDQYINITKTEIAKTISKLNTKKAPGPDKINNKIIQLTITSLLDIIHNIYNICWFKGYHPNNWKTPKSILINKPNKSKKDPNNYRPIALINCLAKIMEKIINVRLTNFIELNDIINKEQAGFRKNKSTHDKLFQLTHKQKIGNKPVRPYSWMWRKHSTKSGTMAYSTPYNNNMPVIFLRFISSFLSNRHTYFQIDHTFSNLIKINHGVPQGSSLSPTLFIIYAANTNTPRNTSLHSKYTRNQSQPLNMLNSLV